MTGLHAKHAPSSMYLTVACPGWLRQSEGLPPQPPTEATQEGELAHAVAAAMAVGALDFAAATEEMLDGAAVWLEALEGYPARIETPVKMLRLHPGGLCWGTPDARQWAPETMTLRAADYKFGHEFVDEFENWQMLAYMVGMADELGVFDNPAMTYEMTVVQPRYYGKPPIRTWKIGMSGLHHYAERMRAAIREAEANNPRVISGTHCTHCPARVTCPTLQRTVMHAVDFTGRPEPMLERAEDVGRELALVQEFIERLEARETGLAASAEAMIRRGERVPFYSLEPSQGRLAWDMPLEVVEATAQIAGKSALKPPELITPTQARDRKILDAAVVEAYSSRPQGKMKLTRDTTTVRKFIA